MKNKKSIFDNQVVFTLLAILIGFIIGAIMLMVTGVSPIAAYGRLISGVFSKPKFIVWAIVYATPLIFTGLAVAFSFRTGVFNIGAEGQFVIGSIAACVAGILIKAPAFIHIPLCILIAAVAGALWGAIVGWLKVKFGINEVLSMIMFNWIAFYLSNYIVNIPIIHKEGGGEATKDIQETARIILPDSVTAKLG